MGINAQTSVPKFSIGEVLTAANTNLLANVIPVFTNTTTRDAAFGGGGEKVLAEGQLCYLESSRQLLTYTGANWANTSGNIGYANGTNTTGIVANTALTVITMAPTILPGRLYRISGRISVQMNTGNAANKFLYITSTPVTRNLSSRFDTIGANLPQTYQGVVFLTSTQFGVTSGTGTAVTINLVFLDTGNAGGLNTDPDGVLGGNTSPQQLMVEDVGSE
jgi:hypothetical protein